MARIELVDLGWIIDMRRKSLVAFIVLDETISRGWFLPPIMSRYKDVVANNVSTETADDYRMISASTEY